MAAQYLSCPTRINRDRSTFFSRWQIGVLAIMISHMLLNFHPQRWLWLIGLGIILGAALAFFTIGRQARQYQASADLLLRLPNGDQTRALALDTYVQLTHSQSILTTAIQAAGLDIGTDELTSDLIVKTDSSGLLTLIVTRAEPEMAAALVKALSEELVAENKRLTANPNVNQLQDQISHLQPEIDSARTAWQTLDDQITKTHDPAALADLRSQRTDAIDHYLLLESDLAAFNSQVTQLTSTLPVLIPITPLAPPVRTDEWQLPIDLAVGSLIGALAGILIGWAVENADIVLRNPAAVQRALDLPTVATLPLITTRAGDEKLIIRTDAPHAEAYRALAVRLGLSDAPPGWTIGITSPGTNEGKSLTAANLAIVVAQAGRRTLIVDADLRTPMQHRLFKLSNRDGLTGLLHEFTLRADAQGDSDALADLLSVSPGLKRTDIANLSILTSGPLPAHPEEILASGYLTRLLRALAAQYDLLVLDLPSAVTPGTAQRMAAGLDLSLLVVDAQRTRRRVARRALNMLRQESGTRIGGVALNRARTRDLRRAD